MKTFLPFLLGALIGSLVVVVISFVIVIINGIAKISFGNTTITEYTERIYYKLDGTIKIECTNGQVYTTTKSNVLLNKINLVKG